MAILISDQVNFMVKYIRLKEECQHLQRSIINKKNIAVINLLPEDFPLIFFDVQLDW